MRALPPALRALAIAAMTAMTLTTASACKPRTPTPPAPPTTEPGAAAGGGARGLMAPEPTPGVRFRLSDASPADGAGPPASVAPSQPLDEADVQAQLRRLPPLPEAASAQVAFALRPGPRPPAIAGDTLRQPFPPDTTAGAPPPAPAAALEVARYQPEGDIQTAPRLAVTFNQPMVPLTSHSALAAADVPVTLEPQPAGQWRWAGSQTVIFEPEGGRFPMATDYRATVPAGTAAAAGTDGGSAGTAAALPAAVTWTFRTPPPALVDHVPAADDTTDRQPIIFLAFDQRVDPAAVLPHLTATAGGAAVALRLAETAEVTADDGIMDRVTHTVEGRWVAVRPVDPLPLDSRVQLTLGAGLPSAEGPLTTTAARTLPFHTYGPLAIAELTCGGQPAITFDSLRHNTASDCEPLAPWWIQLTNDLDLEAFDPAAIAVEPALGGLRVEASGDRIFVSGLSVGRTTYRVTLPAGLRDVYGQTLGDDAVATFNTGDMRPALYAPGDETVVLDPAAGPTFTVYSTNNDRLNVRLLRVEPEQWAAYQDARRRQGDENPPPPPGTEAWSGALEPAGKRDALTAVPIDLTPALADGLGQVLVVVEPGTWAWDDPNWSNRPQWRWVQATRMGLAAFTDTDGVLVWVTDLAGGAPVAGATVAGPPDGQRPTTDADGLAMLDPLGYTADGSEQDAQTVVVARKDGDVSLLPRGWGGWVFSRPDPQLAWYGFTDRGLYKPGETVHFKGLIRVGEPGKGGDVRPLDGGPTDVAWVLRLPNGEEGPTGQLSVNPFGGFDGTVAVPANAELGQAYLELTATGGDMPPLGRTFHLAVHVAEFRRPEFEVSAASEQPYYLLGDRGVVAATAAYYAGGPLPDAETQWSVTGTPASFTPPGQDDFHFGPWRPIWLAWSFGPDQGESTYEVHTGRTDATGAHRLAIDFDGVYPLSAASFRAEASVMDVNRQAWTGSAAFMVHPARDYVGLRADRWFVQAGRPFTVEAIVADLDGRRVAGRAIALRAERVDGTWRGERYVEAFAPAGTCDLTSAAEAAACDLTFEGGGEYRVTADIADADGRPNRTEIRLWVAGGPERPRRGVEREEVQLVPDQAEYQPGDTAEILVQAPFAPAEGLLSIRRSGLVRTERVTLDGPSTTLRVPVDETLLPNFTVQLDLVGAAARSADDGAATDDGAAAGGTDDAAPLPPRPAYASGSIDLSVPPRVRTLGVSATPRDAAVAPGGSTTVDVAVADADGRPLAGAEVALVVVDEAVLALDAYRIPDPVATFYPRRGADVSDLHQRAFVALADPAALAQGGAGGGMADMVAQTGEWSHRSLDGAMMMDFGAEAAPSLAPMAMVAEESKVMRAAGAPAGAPAPAIRERTDLDPLAAFVPGLTTDAEGRVSAAVDLPDNVTRYRVTAVATDGAQRFGTGEHALTARLPLIVRPSAPRFLNFGDVFELPVVVQNQTDGDLVTDVVVRAANLRLTEGAVDAADGTSRAGLRVTVPAGDRVEVRFPAAADMPGTAAFQAGAFAGDVGDAQRVTLPVWTPATTEAFATYGQVDDGAIAQPVRRPPDAVPQFGGLELTTSSTALSELTDAFVYLQTYPYEGSEQIASRLIATVALKDVLFAFGAPGLPDAAEVDATIRRDVDKLAAMQNGDGGWDWWSAAGRSWPFASVHAAHALARAGAKGYAAPAETVERAKRYLTDIDDAMRALDYDAVTRRTMRAYALYVRMLLGDRQPGEARALFAESGDASVEVLGWLLGVLSGDAGSAAEVAEIRRRLANAAVEEAGTAQFTTGYDEEAGNVLLASNRRADAIVLEALIGDQPDSDLIPKVVRGLLEGRVRGRWSSTQENAWVLLALDRYFRAYEGVTPDFVARAWLGDGFVGETAFRGRTADRGQTDVPMAALPEGAVTPVVLQKDGPGRLYYRLGLRYAPRDLVLAPLERGFSVERTYEPVDDPVDVRRGADGTWTIGAGKRVRVRLTLVATARRYHVALVDPLPAGLEAVNPDLAVSASAPPVDDADAVGGDTWPWWRWWRWYDHVAFRDERVEVFGNVVWAGVYTYDYIARATTPGTFVVPPAKAEELYHPETFGRSGSDKVVVR